jgi:hypothetical protein
VSLISPDYHTAHDNYILYIQYQMSAITAPFSGASGACQRHNDTDNAVTATGGNTEYHFFHVTFLW